MGRLPFLSATRPEPVGGLHDDGEMTERCRARILINMPPYVALPNGGGTVVSEVRLSAVLSEFARGRWARRGYPLPAEK